MSISKQIRTQPDYQFPVPIVDILREVDIFSDDQLVRLAEAFRSIENALWRPEVTASYPATLLVGAESSPWKPAHGGHLTELEGILKEVGSTDTEVEAYKTNTSTTTRTLIGTVVIPAGEYTGSIFLNEPFIIGIDMIHYKITAAGTGASHLSMQGRWNEDAKGT